ncbi:cupin domain-containing protein, partial [Streptomyces sp. MBT65]|uniref:cupin domain-containing protein n=1 Tax=Streptomyces sp. MBT65 TaxID=1488395 RepID=UPI001F3AC894
CHAVCAPGVKCTLNTLIRDGGSGAHTAWHTHPHGQVLHVTEGEGLVQRKGGAVESIRAGDTVWIEPDEWHWHGAGPRTFMTHLAVVEAAEDGTTACWDEHVDPANYPA